MIGCMSSGVTCGHEDQCPLLRQCVDVELLEDNNLSQQGSFSLITCDLLAQE